MRINFFVWLSTLDHQTFWVYSRLQLPSNLTEHNYYKASLSPASAE